MSSEGKLIPFQIRSARLPGTSYAEVLKHARLIFHNIERKTRRKTYIRSAYFKKQKIFFDFFWRHLDQKSPEERFKRLKYFKAAIELVERSRNKPISKPNPNRKTEVVHRFAGLTKNKELFYVQIKENKISKKFYLMSCFPPG